MVYDILCACGGNCDGICQDQHLKNTKAVDDGKKEISYCPAAFTSEDFGMYKREKSLRDV